MKKIILLTLVALMIISFMPTSVHAQDYSATVIFKHEDKEVEKTFTDPNEVVGLQGFPGDIGFWVFKTYLAGWGTHESLDLYNPEHNLYLTNTKISDIFPNGTTESVTLYAYYIGMGNIKLSENKVEINKGMDGEATVPGAEIKDIERDDDDRLTKVIVYYDENKDSYSLNLKANLQMERNAAVLSWMNPGGIFSNSGQQWGSVEIKAPYTHIDLDMAIDERIEMTKEMSLHFKSYSFKHQHTIGNLSSGRVGYKSISNTISVNNPVNVRLADRNETKEGETLTEFKNNLIVRTSIRNDGNPNYHTRNATLDEIYKDMELYTEDSEFFLVSKELAEKIAKREEEPIKISGKIYGNIRPGGVDTGLHEISSQELVIDFVKREEKKTVTFNKNTSQFGDTQEQTHEIVELSEDEMIVGDKMPANPTFEINGRVYEFLGWNTKADGTGEEFTRDSDVISDMVVYAQWKSEDLPTKFVVRYNANGGTGAVPTGGSYEKGTEVRVKFTPAPTKEGHTFLGWDTNKDATTPTYKSDGTTTFIMPGNSVTLYAIYDKIPATKLVVRYDANGGTGPVPASEAYDAGEIVNVSFTPAPTKYGYNFLGWSENPNANAPTYRIGGLERFTMPNRDVTLYAVYDTTPDNGGGLIDILIPYYPVTPSTPSTPSVPTVPSKGVGDILNTIDHIAYVQGYPNGTFMPAKAIDRGEVTAIFTRLMIEQMEVDGNYPNTFTDVNPDDWYARHIGYAEMKGLIKGYPDNTFRPDKAITRGEFAALSARFDNSDVGSEGLSFSDVPSTHWAYESILKAEKLGWIKGYPDNTFRPDEIITREEVVTIVNRMLNRKADEKYVEDHRNELVQYTDLQTNHWSYLDIMEASNSHDYNRVGVIDELWIRLIPNR